MGREINFEIKDDNKYRKFKKDLQKEFSVVGAIYEIYLSELGGGPDIDFLKGVDYILII